MLQRLVSFAERYAMFPNSARLGVAVSGGADSVFLLHALRELAPRWNLRLSVLHVEHGIRGAASQADAGFVRDLAAGFGLPLHLHSADATAVPGNLEQAARRIRQQFFSELIRSGRVDRVATGHTRNDQAETVLYRILRGSGLQGLCGILPVTQEGLVRPLLLFERTQIESWLRERSIAWREDETNRDSAYARNRLRHQILPLLRQSFNPNLDEALANLATLAQDEENDWESRLPAETGPLLAVPNLSGSPARARRLIRRAIRQCKGDLRQVDFGHVEAILEMARSGEGHGAVQIPGLTVIRSFDWVRFCVPAAAAAPGYCLALHPPESVELPGDTARITLQVLEKAESTPACGKVVNELDWQRLHPSRGALTGLELRNWRAGDQYRRVGQSKPQKLKDLFQEARVPLWERRNWPIITYNGTIAWARRFGAAAEFAAESPTRIVLRVEDPAGSKTGIDRGVTDV